MVTGTAQHHPPLASPRAFPAQFRRRLALFCAGSVAASTALFGIGSFAFIRDDKLDRFTAAAEREAALHLAMAEAHQRDPLPALGDVLAGGGRAAVVLQEQGTSVATAPDVGLDDVPSAIRQDRQGQRSATTTVGRTSYLVVGGALPGRSGRGYFFFGRRDILDDINTVARVLAVAWLIVTACAAAVSARVARRALWPVRKAAAAAQDLASGLLGTRLPVEGNDEFAAWAASFNHMADELERRIAREQRFTADVAHELRTPVGSVLTAASLLEAQLEELPADARRPAELIAQGLRRLRRLVDELLEISRLESGRDNLSLSEVELLTRVRHLVASRDWSDRVAVEGSHIRLVTDPRRVDRVVGNLIENAIRHGRPPIAVAVNDRHGDAVIDVTDHGGGIPAADLAKLFEPFHKRDAARPGPGSGLGLAIAAHQARLLGGRVDVTSRPGETRFVLVLPHAPPGDVQPTR